MPKITLTDIAVQNLKPPTGNQVDYWDKSLPGFGVRVAKGGTKTFVVMQDRRRKSIGKYPAVSLKQARFEAKRMLYDRAGYEREQQKLEVSFPEAVERYLRLKEGELRPGTLEGYARFLRSFEFRCLVSEIRPYQVEDALARVVGQTNRSHAYTVLKVFFGWCLAREYCQSNPLQNLKKPRIPSSRERVLSDDELKVVWDACGELGKYGAIVRLLMLTGQRKGQIARLQTSWVAGEAITFPADVMKNNRQHWCPIGKVSEFLLLQLVPVDGYYFSPASAVGNPFSNWSKSKKKLDKLADLDPWCLHDLRRTWSTNAPRLDIPPHVTARVLSHTSEENKIWQIYNRHQYRQEMREAMHKMETHILSLIGE